MKLLVDTCTFLWLAADDPELSPAARTVCRAPENEVYFSSLSAWEIAIKYRLGRLPLPTPPGRYVVDRREWLQLRPLAFDEGPARRTTRYCPRTMPIRSTGVWCRRRSCTG